MIIHGTQKVNIDIDDCTARQVAIEVLRTMFNFPEGHYIDWEHGMTMNAEEVQYGAHSSTERTQVRGATDNDRAVATILRQLKKGRVVNE